MLVQNLLHHTDANWRLTMTDCLDYINGLPIAPTVRTLEDMFSYTMLHGQRSYFIIPIANHA